MDKILNIEIITPNEIKYKGDIKVFVAPGSLGTLGILPDHAPLITSLEIGKIMLRLMDNSEISMVIGGGLLEVNSNKIILLADMADTIEDIDPEKEKLSLRKLEEKLFSCNNEKDRIPLRRNIKIINNRLSLVLDSNKKV